MKKYIIVIALLLGALSSFAQSNTDITKLTFYRYSYGQRFFRLMADSALIIPSDTTFNKVVGSIAYLNGAFYVKNITKWETISGGGGGGSYTNGYGLLLGGSEFAVDTNLITSKFWHNKGMDSLGAIIATKENALTFANGLIRTSNTIQVDTGRTAIAIATGGALLKVADSLAALGGPNFANADLTQTSDRAYNGDGFNLDMSNITNFFISSKIFNPYVDEPASPTVSGNHVLRSIVMSDDEGAFMSSQDLTNNNDATFRADPTAQNLSMVLDSTGIRNEFQLNKWGFDFQSTTRPLVYPRLTKAQRDAITALTTGGIVWLTDSSYLSIYNGSEWVKVGGGSGTVTSIATGLGLLGGPITTTGTIVLDTASTVVLSRQRAANTFEPIITAGTTAQYWRGDKTFQTLDKTAVGLSNVDNTSDATKNSASATLTNKTIDGSNNTITNVSLTTGVTGTLGYANGGTNVTTSNDLYSNYSLSFKRNNGYDYFGEFTNPVATAATANELIATNSGTGAGNSVVNSTDRNRPGILRLTTGTTATGRATISTNGSAIGFSGGKWIWEQVINMTQTSNATNRFQFLAGYFDTYTTVNQIDGAYFLYDEGGVTTGSAASANWQLVTSNNSARTFTTSSTSVSTGAYVKLRIEVDAAGANVDFYIDGANVGTISTNIPTASARVTGYGALLIKSIGTTAVTCDTDYMLANCIYTTPR